MHAMDKEIDILIIENEPFVKREIRIYLNGWLAGWRAQALNRQPHRYIHMHRALINENECIYHTHRKMDENKTAAIAAMRCS